MEREIKRPLTNQELRSQFLLGQKTSRIFFLKLIQEKKFFTFWKNLITRVPPCKKREKFFSLDLLEIGLSKRFLDQKDDLTRLK